MIALQGLDRLEYIHSKNIIHRDIKPHNFLIGRKDTTIIYLIDFGLAKKYKSSRTGKFIKFTNLGAVFGSMAYSSINANAGYEQSRRDDLESFGYMLICLAKKNLPWMKLNIKMTIKEKVIESCKLKRGIKLEKLCEGLPEEFIDYIKYCRKLEFEQEPNYDYLRNLFFLILIKENQKNDLNFFWINKNNAKSITKNYENNSINKRDTHKRLYNSVKKSLEKKRKEGTNNTLKSDYSKNNNSLNKANDNQNNKKGIQKMDSIYKNLKIKNLNDKTEVKNNITDNNINEINFTIPRIDEQKFDNSLEILKNNRVISNNASCYNSKVQFENVKIKNQKIISDNTGIKNTFYFSNQKINNTMNIISNNYCNFKGNNNNNYQNKKNIINNNYYYSNANSNQITSNYRMIPEIYYSLNSNSLKLPDNKNRNENYNVYSFQNHKKNIRILDYKNKNENYSVYSLQNHKKNIRDLYNKYRNENYSVYSFKNDKKNFRDLDNINGFENMSFYSFHNNK